MCACACLPTGVNSWQTEHQLTNSARQQTMEFSTHTTRQILHVENTFSENYISI